MVQFPTRRRLVGAGAVLLALASVSCLTPVSRGDPQPRAGARRGQNANPNAPLTFERKVAGDSQPIRLDADQVVTWVEQRKRVVMLQGAVLVRHGTVQVRAQQAVAVVDLDERKRRGIYRVALMLEGTVVLDTPVGTRRSARATGELSTRGEIRLKSARQTVVKRPAREAAVYRRAQAALAETVASWNPEPTGGGEEVAEPKSSPSTPVPPPPPGSGSRSAKPRAGGLKFRGQSPTPPPAPGPGLSPLGAGPGSAPPAPGSNSLLSYSISPRLGSGFKIESDKTSTGEPVTIVTGGVVVSVKGVEGIGLLDIEADNAVIWSKGDDGRDLINQMRRPGGTRSRELELYLSGRVEIRQGAGEEKQTLRAAEVYYDAQRKVAYAVNADLEVEQPSLPYPLHVRAQELRQLSPTKFEAIEATVFASQLPSDPGFTVHLMEATVERRQVPKQGLFGNQVVDRVTGEPLFVEQLYTTGRNAVARIEGVPFFYLPRFQGDARDPLGPLESVRFGYDQIFGARFGVTLNVHDLFGIQAPPSTRWTLGLDYLSERGPAIGTEYDYATETWFGLPAVVSGRFEGFAIHDTGEDNLGRPNPFGHPDFRYRARWLQNVQDLPAGFSVQSQFVRHSDRNFYEQYYKLRFDQEIDQETFLYVKQLQGNFGWTGFFRPRLHDWVTQTEWLPRVDGYLLGRNLFDLFTYHAHGSIGYARLETSDDPFPPVSPTDVDTATARADLHQEISAPFYLGPVKVAPYGVLALTYYTEALNGEDEGRLYGGGGARANMPLSRLYTDAHSELFNVAGLNHKVNLGANYYMAGSTDSFLLFPQLDRFNDIASDRALRELTPIQTTINPGAGAALATSPLFDPQTYAIRRLMHHNPDAREDIHILQLKASQRLQTKRGFPGRKHIVNWMELDVSASIFPAGDRDNFGENFAFLEYDYLWNIGDRTALTSTGWFDPHEDGARVFTFGAQASRSDRTAVFLGYRQIDPLQSKAVTASVSYIFSPKYAMAFASVYDFGITESLSNSFVLTRIGKDLAISVSVAYNALQNNFAYNLVIAPTIFSPQGGPAAGGIFSALGTAGLVNR